MKSLTTPKFKDLLTKMKLLLKEDGREITNNLGISNAIWRPDLPEIISFVLEDLGESTFYIQEDSEYLIPNMEGDDKEEYDEENEDDDEDGEEDDEEELQNVLELKEYWGDRLKVLAYSAKSRKEICESGSEKCKHIDYLLFKTYSENSEKYIKDWVDNFKIE